MGCVFINSRPAALLAIQSRRGAFTIRGRRATSPPQVGVPFTNTWRKVKSLTARINRLWTSCTLDHRSRDAKRWFRFFCSGWMLPPLINFRKCLVRWSRIREPRIVPAISIRRKANRTWNISPGHLNTNSLNNSFQYTNNSCLARFFPAVP